MSAATAAALFNCQFLLLASKHAARQHIMRTHAVLQQARLPLAVVHPRTIALRVQLPHLCLAGIACGGGERGAHVILAEWGAGLRSR